MVTLVLLTAVQLTIYDPFRFFFHLIEERTMSFADGVTQSHKNL